MDKDDLLLLDTAEDVAWTASELIANRLLAYPDARLALPTGGTPLRTYELLDKHVETGDVSLSAATFFMLDEYLELPPLSPHSYSHYLHQRFDKYDFKFFHELNGATDDPRKECLRYQQLIDAAPLDLVVLGLGRNGHVAFNEPGATPEQGVREVSLDKTTREDAAGDFGDISLVPARALTIGLADLLKARELVVLATGDRKAGALSKLLSGDPAFPAYCLLPHPRLTILSDQAAREGLI